MNGTVNPTLVAQRHLPGDPGRAVPEAIREFRSNPDNVFLVSFPRTGSHWLRMLMELYFGQPLLVRSFFNFSHENYLLLHTHDMHLAERPKNVIYLYRDPVETVYSQIHYEKESYRSLASVIQWARHYALHLLHWLIGEEFTKRKTILRYEDMRDHLDAMFEAVCAHFDEPFVAERLHALSPIVTKETVAQKAAVYDERVMSMGAEYKEGKPWFREHMEGLVWATVRSVAKAKAGGERLLEVLSPPPTAIPRSDAMLNTVARIYATNPALHTLNGLWEEVTDAYG